MALDLHIAAKHVLCAIWSTALDLHSCIAFISFITFDRTVRTTAVVAVMSSLQLLQTDGVITPVWLILNQGFFAKGKICIGMSKVCTCAVG